jgi:ubiquinone/menaquinone biosynthesis C-methylase UbiE
VISQTHPAAFWNKEAAKYAATPIKDMAGYERSIARTIELIHGMNAVAELGCGTGMTARYLAGHVGQLTATDLSPAMIALAEQKRTEAKIDNATFNVASAADSGLASEAYDAVLAFNLLHLTPDPATVLTEARRLLKPGALLIAKTPCIREMSPFIRYAIPVMQAIGKAPEIVMFDAQQLEQLFVSAGFVIEEKARHGSKKKDPRLFIVARKPIS